MGGFKVLAANPALQKIRDDMRAEKARKEAERQGRLDRIRASHSQPALDLNAKLSARAKRILANGST